jgi:hypothetical protein
MYKSEQVEKANFLMIGVYSFVNDWDEKWSWQEKWVNLTSSMSLRVEAKRTSEFTK